MAEKVKEHIVGEGSVGQKAKSTFREYAEAIGMALLLALFIRTFIVQAFKPDRKVDYGQCHPLRAHDPFEAGGLSFLGKRQIEANQEFFTMFEGGFARSEE